jgi:PKD repeat protein
MKAPARLLARLQASDNKAYNTGPSAESLDDMNATHAILVAAGMLAMGLSGCLNGGSDALSAAFTATTTDNKTFKFDAGTSKGPIAKYLWSFGDGGTATTKTAEHTYEYINGDYTVVLVIEDASGNKGTATKVVTTGTEPNAAPDLHLLATKRYVKPNETILFDARATVDPDGDPITLTWDMNYDIDVSQETQTMVNLGIVMYKDAKNASSSSSAGSESEEEGLRYAPPTPEEIKRAQDRHLQRLSTRHGGETNPYKKDPQNTEFDGAIDDKAPVVIFSWPAPATYYVRLDATDIKGTMKSGFMAIRVADDAPARHENESFHLNLTYAGPDPPVTNENIKNRASSDSRMGYPGAMTVDVKVVSTSYGSVPLNLYMCRRLVTFDTCKNSPLMQATGTVAAGSSLPQQLFELFDADPTTFTIYIVALSETPQAAQVYIKVDVKKTYDTNPWFTHEINPDSH